MRLSRRTRRQCSFAPLPALLLAVSCGSSGVSGEGRTLYAPGQPPPTREDRDGGDIPNDDDLCPDTAEDRDRFEDAEGCPDPDSDADGVSDVEDRCPDEPEDRDGFEDGDGCPDPDNDLDGIPDLDDKCPLQPRIDRPGCDAFDGCPDDCQKPLEIAE